MFITFALALIAGITLLVLQLIGFDSLTQVFGFNRLIEHFEFGPAPKI